MGIGELYVDNYVNDSGVTDANCIMLCIDEAIRYGKKAVFTRGKEYLLDKAIVISNETNTANAAKGINSLKPICIDFNGAIIKADQDVFGVEETESTEEAESTEETTEETVNDPQKSLIYLAAASNNGNIVNHISNLRADATGATYGIYAASSVRLRMENIDITNGIDGAIHIASGIETYIDKFSLFRTETGNTEKINSVGIECNATDCYFSNGVIVNYLTACKSGPAVTWDKCHPWNWYADGDIYNLEVVRAGVGFAVNGLTNITNCEFDSTSVCVRIINKGDAYAKQPVNIDNCMLIMSAYYKRSGVCAPVLVYLEKGTGSNVHVTNLGHYQTYQDMTVFCNSPNNQIRYDYSEKRMQNLPNTKVYRGAYGKVTGEFLSIECDVIKNIYEDTIMVSGKNLMDTKQLAADINSGVDSALNSITQDGVKLTLDNDGIILIDTSGVEVSSEEETFTKNFFLLGAWGTEKVMMFKEGYTYCISRPLVTDVSISFITHNPNDGYNVFKYIGGTTSNPYELYHCTEDIAVVGVYLSVKIKALSSFDENGKREYTPNLADFKYAPYINISSTPEIYEKGKVDMVAPGDKTNTNGFCYVTAPTGKDVTVEYYDDKLFYILEKLDLL